MQTFTDSDSFLNSTSGVEYFKATLQITLCNSPFVILVISKF